MFEAEAFVVAFQTEFQKSLFETFASSIICIDSTHKTNCHAFKLITVIVPDEFGEGKWNVYTLLTLCIWLIQFNILGQPVAWCIADKEDTTVMKLFLQKLKDRCPCAEVKTIMTDDGIILKVTG